MVLHASEQRQRALRGPGYPTAPCPLCLFTQRLRCPTGSQLPLEKWQSRGAPSLSAESIVEPKSAALGQDSSREVNAKRASWISLSSRVPDQLKRTRGHHGLGEGAWLSSALQHRLPPCANTQPQRCVRFASLITNAELPLAGNR